MAIATTQANINIKESLQEDYAVEDQLKDLLVKERLP